MRNFLEEYGSSILVIITGIMIIVSFIGLLSNAQLSQMMFLTDESTTLLGVQQVANDESLKSKNITPILKTHDLVVEFGSTFEISDYVGDGCTTDCFEAYIEDDGVKTDLSKFVDIITEDGNPIDTTISGQHDVTFVLRWNNEFIRNKGKVFVTEDPNAPDVDDPSILQNYVRGVLKDVDGNGVEAHLQLSAQSQDGTVLVFNANSGASGSFIIYGIKPGLTYELYVVGYEGTPLSTFKYEGGQYNLGYVGVN